MKLDFNKKIVRRDRHPINWMEVTPEGILYEIDIPGTSIQLEIRTAPSGIATLGEIRNADLINVSCQWANVWHSNHHTIITAWYSNKAACLTTPAQGNRYLARREHGDQDITNWEFFSASTEVE